MVTIGNDMYFLLVSLPTGKRGFAKGPLPMPLIQAPWRGLAENTERGSHVMCALLLVSFGECSKDSD